MNYIDLSKLSISDANNASCVVALNENKDVILINNRTNETDLQITTLKSRLMHFRITLKQMN